MDEELLYLKMFFLWDKNICRILRLERSWFFILVLYLVWDILFKLFNSF